MTPKLKTASIFAAVALALGLAGCQTMTPEQKAKSDAAKNAFAEAGLVVEKAQTQLDVFMAEYKLIKARLDAGESLPAVLVTRYAELQKLIAGATVDVREAVAKYDAAKKANEEAALAGVAWYNRIDWWTVGKVASGIAIGLAGLYFPALKPLAAAGQAVIQGVAGTAPALAELGKDGKLPALSVEQQAAVMQIVKDSVLAKSRELGVEGKLDALVQQFDPPKS